MTEAEWLECKAPWSMLLYARDVVRASDRTCRLFIAAYWAVKARGLAKKERLIAQRQLVATEHWADTGRLPKGQRESRSEAVIFHNRNARTAFMICVPVYPVPTAGRGAFKHVPCLLHDIFGNPFRPFTFASEWRTDTATAIAAQMYESRDFSAMPILADALQDAGCDSDDILSHCRDPQQIHVRGCWVVDLVLGKE